MLSKQTDVLFNSVYIQCFVFILRYDIHLIVDEIYALCCYGEKIFTSFTEIIQTKNSHRIHVLWGFSKVC